MNTDELIKDIKELILVLELFLEKINTHELSESDIDYIGCGR